MSMGPGNEFGVLQLLGDPPSQGFSCYSPIFSLICSSHDRVFRPYTYLTNSKVDENYYTQ
jgi:hypothetical protein